MKLTLEQLGDICVEWTQEQLINNEDPNWQKITNDLNVYLYEHACIPFNKECGCCTIISIVLYVQDKGDKWDVDYHLIERPTRERLH